MKIIKEIFVILLVVVCLAIVCLTIFDAVKTTINNCVNANAFNQYDSEEKRQSVSDRIKNFEDCVIPPEEEKPNPYPPQKAMPPIFNDFP